MIIKLRTRYRSGEGQARLRKVRERFIDLSYTINLVFTTTTTTTTHHTNFFLGF